MKILLFLITSFCALVYTSHAQLLEPTAKKEPTIYDSIVRIEVSTQVSNYKSPWKTGSFSGGTGTGFLIGENLFMTNAHVVSNQKRVLITKHGSSQKYKANVLHVAHDCDLAILSVDDFSAFKGLKKLEFANVPELESSVRVIGYPIGGDRISVTRGVVSRIDFSAYAHSSIDAHLIVQIDAAINPGNSGGPVLQDNKVVGVAFQGLTQADNTGFMIPTPVVKRFLKDIEDGVYDEYVELGISIFPLFNPAMREALNVKQNAPGVLVTNVLKGSSADGLIENNDILTKIDGYPIDSSGSISIHGERVDMNEVVERKFVDDKVKLEIIRAGEVKEVQVTLAKFTYSKIFARKYEEQPRYTIKGGLVFQPLDMNLYSISRFRSPRLRKLYSNYVSDEVYIDREDIVVLTKVLKDPVNSALSIFAGNPVESINGVKVKSIKHLHELLNPETLPEYFEIVCDGISRPIILPTALVNEADQRIKKQYGIQSFYNLEK